MQLLRVSCLTLWLALLALLTGCSYHSPSAQFSADLTTITSWAATAHMVSEEWARQAVPNAYAKQTLQVAREELQTAVATLKQLQLSGASAQQRATLLRHVQRINQLLGQMSKVVEQEKRDAMAPLRRQLATEEKAINTLAKSAQSVKKAGGQA
jgi:hypothetical protein